MSAVSTDTRSRDAVAPPLFRGPAQRDASRRPSSVGARVAWVVVLGLFLTFFMLPVVWLILAPTRTDGDIIRGNGLSFGSLENFATAWRHIFDYQDGALSDLGGGSYHTPGLVTSGATARRAVGRWILVAAAVLGVLIILGGVLIANKRRDDIERERRLHERWLELQQQQQSETPAEAQP